MAAAMITLVKKFTYRGNPLEEWSNSYHLDSTPPDLTAWKAMCGSSYLGGMETTLYTASTTLIRALCYEDSDNPATYVLDLVALGLSATGSLATTGLSRFAGDQAATVGIDTGLTGSTGKKIWLRKYYHDGVEITATPDSLGAAYVTALGAMATYLLGTALHGTVYYADKNGRRPTGLGRVDPYSTTRTLKRRGKRPTP